MVKTSQYCKHFWIWNYESHWDICNSIFGTRSQTPFKMMTKPPIHNPFRYIAKFLSTMHQHSTLWTIPTGNYTIHLHSGNDTNLIWLHMIDNLFNVENIIILPVRLLCHGVLSCCCLHHVHLAVCIFWSNDQ